MPEQVQPLPEALYRRGPPLARWRAEGRTITISGSARTAKALATTTLARRIGTLTLKLTGKRIPPHFFRDAAATTLARSRRKARLIRPVLAHSGFRTAERHYIHAQTIEAGRDYAALHQPPEERTIMTRVAIYARFSSTMQREASIEDQLRLCRDRAEREGWTVADLHRHGDLRREPHRPGFQA